MSSEALYDATFRARLLRQALSTDEMAQFVEAAESLVARLEQELTLREQSQIPVIPRGAQAQMKRLEAALAVAREREQRLHMLLTDWLQYTGLRDRAFAADLDPDDDEYASGRDLIGRTDAALVDEPAAATLAEPEARVQGTGGTPAASVRTDGPGSASAAADEPGEGKP